MNPKLGANSRDNYYLALLSSEPKIVVMPIRHYLPKGSESFADRLISLQCHFCQGGGGIARRPDHRRCRRQKARHCQYREVLGTVRMGVNFCACIAGCYTINRAARPFFRSALL